MQYGVERIGENAFRECSSLKEVVMPDSVIEVGASKLFKDCTNLATVQLSNNITTIATYKRLAGLYKFEQQ